MILAPADRQANDLLIDPNNPEYVLGEPSMDATHQEFIELVNRIPTLEKDAFIEGFNQLLQHTREHFDIEKELMERTGFPAIREHDAEHHRVLSELEFMGKRAAEGSTHMARTYVEMGMPLWFALHAATMDSALAAHVIKHAQRETP
jgi:hemerythrin-like metal-binding protein